MIDTRNNLLTTILAGLIGLLGVVALALFLILGPVDTQEIEPLGETSVPRVAVATPEKGLEAFDEYGEIVRRPVFFSDRRLPVVVVAEAEDELEIAEEVEEEPIPELNASVAGIIITPDLRIAMIKDQKANSTMVLSEGMNLEGEQAAWKLQSIESRRVNFVSVDGRNTGLELEVNTRGLTRPTRTRAAAAEEAPPEEAGAEETAAPQPDEEALSRAEEIRRRVAERRAELRAEAERRAQEQQDNE